MYKLNKGTKATIFAGCIGIGILGYNETIKETELNPETVTEEETKTEPFIMLDQELNGCIVYKLETRKITATGKDLPWQESMYYYIGTIDETCNDIIESSDNEQFRKIPIGIIDNEYTQEDCTVTIKTYYEEAYDNGEWYKTGNYHITENGTLGPKRCLSRWTLDTIKTEERIPQRSIATYCQGPESIAVELPQLMQGYKLTYENREYVMTPTGVFTTIGNIPRDDIIWLPAGPYTTSYELDEQKEKKQ